MTITASSLRNNIYRLLDSVLESGEPIEIQRKGHVLKITYQEAPDKLSRLTKHTCINGDPQDLVHIDWSKEWHHDLP